MAIIQVNKENFENEVLKAEVPVVADFYAEWCGPCKAMRPVLEKLAESDPGFKIVSINTDEEDELAEQYEISAIPCLIVFKEGGEVGRSVGLISGEAVAELAKGR